MRKGNKLLDKPTWVRITVIAVTGMHMKTIPLGGHYFAEQTGMELNGSVTLFCKTEP